MHVLYTYQCGFRRAFNSKQCLMAIFGRWYSAVSKNFLLVKDDLNEVILTLGFFYNHAPQESIRQK